MLCLGVVLIAVDSYCIASHCPKRYICLAACRLPE